MVNNCSIQLIIMIYDLQFEGGYGNSKVKFYTVLGQSCFMTGASQSKLWKFPPVFEEDQV